MQRLTLSSLVLFKFMSMDVLPVCVWMSAHQLYVWTGTGIKFPGTGVTDIGEPCGCWEELNLGPLDCSEKYMLLTTESAPITELRHS